MKKIILPIDTKSLYLNILNDNKKGHTCTVATPIRQGKSINMELQQIFKIPKQIDFEKYESLLNDLIKNSKTDVKINNVFVFDKLKVNNIPLNSDKKFCIFVKEEIDSSKAQFGRIKMHYPRGLSNDDLSIDNNAILSLISDEIKGYAGIVKSFEYSFEDDSLNFNVLIVGYQNIPYSKVFINNKGVGSKFTNVFSNFSDCYDVEIIPLKKKKGDCVGVSNFHEFMFEARKKAMSIVESILIGKGAKNILQISDCYPYSTFDIQFELDDKLYYLIVKCTYSNIIYADCTSENIRFLNMFENSRLVIITDIDGDNVINYFDGNQLELFSSKVKEIRLLK